MINPMVLLSLLAEKQEECLRLREELARLQAENEASANKGTVK